LLGLPPVADVRPLRGVRFDPRLSGPVGPLLAPPYDVAALPNGGAEFNIRRIEDVDLGGGDGNHALAARRYRAWLERGVLRRDEEPAIYIHRHRFASDELALTRTGLLARVRLSDWVERVVLPHERTTPGPRRERFARLRAVGANLSPLYFLFRDHDGRIQELIRQHAPSAGAPDEWDRMGGTHRLTPVTDPGFHAAIEEAFAGRTVFVADGHHRYEAALAYRDECRRTYGVDRDAPWEFVLVLLAAAEDPGVVVRPTHRLLVGAQEKPAQSLPALLERWFRLGPADASGTAFGEDSLFRVALPEEGGFWNVSTRPGNPHLALLPRDRGGAWRALGVSAVEGVLESLLGVAARGGDARAVPLVDELEAARQVRAGRAQAAFLLPQPSLSQLLAVAEEGDLLPPKSSWFEPKAPAGLVINDLSGEDGQTARRPDGK
jgi:uncharacterized protein (DUF1015 family)